MKTKVYKACKEYIESYKDIDDIRLNVDTYVNILLRKHPKTPVELLMKPACIEYVADGNLAEYPDTQFDDLVEIFKTQAKSLSMRFISRSRFATKSRNMVLTHGMRSTTTSLSTTNISNKKEPTGLLLCGTEK